MPEDCGSTSVSTICAAIAASTALPPGLEYAQRRLRRQRMGRHHHLGFRGGRLAGRGRGLQRRTEDSEQDADQQADAMHSGRAAS